MPASTPPAVSLVVISYEMARVLPRTILSLLPPYQRDIDPADIEILVIDNGSAAPPPSDAFGPMGSRVRVLSANPASPSPVAAINQGLDLAQADLVGVFIDGARLASPGLLTACLAAARLHPRPVVATINYQLGPGLQYQTVPNGYGPETEDALLASIAWPDADGYRLFGIAACELRAGPAGPMLESNALFMPRVLWRELGGYDPAFTEPGGGVVNPDTLSRACRLPGVQLIRILGEGTFHQYHGGLSTSTPESAIRTLQQGSRAYLRRRGRPLAPVRQVGWLFDGPRRELITTPTDREVLASCPAA
ncbi:MAG: glycosyltransferase family 2 protein [Acetobacteraceae bacterium]